MVAMAVSSLLLICLNVTLIFLLLDEVDGTQTEPNLCNSSCVGFPTLDSSYQRGVRYTYRYSTTITTTLHGSNAGRTGLALDCVVDIDVVSKCHLMMQIRNPQIKRLSPQKEHSVQRLKSLRESLERTRLKFSLQEGKVTALCLQEGEQVWALNIKRALLSMLQTSRMASKQEMEKETDVYGTCTSRYERRGPVLLKTRDVKQCQESRLANFWPHSVSLTEDTSVQMELHCVQRHGSTVMEEVNCTEAVSMATWSRAAGVVKTKTVSTLLLLRAQPGAPLGAESLNLGVLADLQFEDEGPARPGKARAWTPQQASETVRLLCSLTSDPQLVSQKFLELAFQLRDLTLSQLKTLWQESSFKCRNDWQPLLEALPACGSENCIVLLTELMRSKELEEEQTRALLTTIALLPHPSPKIIHSLNALLDDPQVRAKALLAGSSLVYQLCQRSQGSCSELPQVKSFIETLEETLKEGCKGHQTTRVKRSVLLQLYRSSQEDPEVRIAAYQQLMRCSDPNVFEVVKMTLRNETSSQVGSYVWSHLTNVLSSEDPMKQALINSLPDDIISRDFEAEFLKYSSYSDHTVSSGMGITNVETSLVFSPKSFLPRSASASLTLYFHGRAHNLLETDVYGTCTSRYERRGPVLLKTRDVKQCQESRLANFWPHSVSLTEDTSVQMELHCVQRHGSTVMEEVNCTEAVSMATWSRAAGVVKTKTVSTLLLLRAQPGAPLGAESLNLGVLADLQFEDEGPARPGKARAWTPQQASETVRLLCSLTSDPQLVSQKFLELAFQLRDLTLSQLKTLWQESSFKCRNDWQPLLEALPACGSENCIVLLTELMRSKELEEEQTRALLTTIALLPHPSPKIIHSLNALLDDPQVRAKALLAGSSLVYQLCQRSQGSCSELPQVKSFIETLEETLKEGCKGHQTTRVKLLYTLKSMGNAGVSAATFIPLLKCFLLGSSTALELRLAATQAFRRFPCSADRSVLLQLYRSSQEDPEVRIAAYQQLMRCSDPNVFEVVKMTLRNETSSQVGSYVWSHLTNVLSSEDPMKQALINSLPDDIISRDFEAEFLKYSSYSDHTVSSGMGITNVETSLVFSPKSFLPRSASASLTLYFHGRAHNLLEVDLHVENAEPLLKSVFGHQNFNSGTESATQSQKTQPKATRTRRQTDDEHGAEKEKCLSGTNSYLSQARAMLFGRRRTEENRPTCWVGVKVFGNELSVFTCEDLYGQIDQLALSVAGLAVKLLKGQEVQLDHRAALMTDELVLPSLSGLPVKLSINATSLLSLRLKGNFNYRDTSHFSLTGYIKPSAYVGLSAMMGVDGALGQAAVVWVSELKSSTSLDGSIQLQEGQDARVTLNTPQDVMDIFSLSSKVFQISGDHREEIKGPKTQVQKTTCTPKTLSKMVGWQLCSNASYPSPATGFSLPAPGPVHLSLRLLKLDRGLHYYLLEAAYSLLPQRGSWLPKEASIHLLLATPQSSIPRDMSVDLTFNPHRLLLRITHPLKIIQLQGQLEQERTIKSGKLELLIDGSHYYVMGLVDTQTLLSEQRTRFHLEAKVAADGHPMILSANVTRGLGRKTRFSATVKNVFRETASMSVALERRRDASSRQHSVEADILIPDVVGTRMLGLMERKGFLWSSALRLKYGLGGDARHLRHECYASQRLKSERDSNLTLTLRADHEFYCSNTGPINHKVHLRHEEGRGHIKSSLDMSYGKHWDEINNKRTILLSQSFRNQSTQNHTSYTLEFGLQVPEKNLNYRTQLLHSHTRQLWSESSTHLKIHYNNVMPLVARLHWKRPPKDAPQKQWEGTFNMDTPWLYVYTVHKLSQHQRHALQLTSELTANRWLVIRDLRLEGFYRDRGREREARLELSTQAVTYIQAAGRCSVGRQSVEASGSLKSLWTPPLRGDVSLETSKFSHTLQMASTYGKHNASLTAALNTLDKSLKRRQAILKMTFSKPKGPATELQFEGLVEELRKDKKMYQKTAMLQLRQPFQTFPQTLLLRETFTVDLVQGLYILESKGGFYGNREVIHTLTLGYQPQSPFLCSALVHPFSSDTVPSDSEACVIITSNQTQKDIQGRLRVGSKEKLTFFGRVQLNPLHSSHQVITVKANFTHQLQLQFPYAAIVEGNVSWIAKSNSDFDYQAKGKLRIERQESQLSVQLNGTSGRIRLYSSLSHPFKSKIPKTLEAKATADLFAAAGTGSSSVHVRADGKDTVKLNAQMSHTFQGGDRAVGLKVNVSQSLLPSATDMHVNMAANMSPDRVSLQGSYAHGREALLVQLRGSLKDTGGLQLAVSGDLRHSMAHLAAFPPVLGLDGVLGQSDTLVEGQLRVRVMETLYKVELRHQEAAGDASDSEEEESTTGKTPHVARDWLCVWLGAEHFCVNASRRLAGGGRGEVNTSLSHALRLLNATGIYASSKVQVRWAQDGERLSVLAELQAGPERLKAEFDGGKTHLVPLRWEYFSRLQNQVQALLKSGVSSSIEAKAHYQLEAGGLDTSLVLHMEDERMADILFNIGSQNSTAILVVSLWQQIQQLKGVIPTSLQMNCTGEATADRLSTQCYGNVAGRPVETLLPSQTSANITITRSGCSTHLRTILLTEGEQKGSLSVHLTCHPHLGLKASVQHSIDAVEMLGFPAHGAILLNVSTAHLPGVELGLELGRCYFRGNLGEMDASYMEEQSSYAVNLTNDCPALQGTLLPASLALQGLLSVAPCLRNVTSSLRADGRDVSLELSQSCSPPRFSGTLTHSFIGPRSGGVPQRIAVEATAPRGPEQAGSLFVRAGSCYIRVNRDEKTNGRTRWLWALESKCPILQAHLNGSVWQDPLGVWTATVDTNLGGKMAFLRLNASARPELSVEGELIHNLLHHLPERSRLKVTCRGGKHRYGTEAVIQMEECAVGASAALMSQPALQGLLVYHNNCTMIQGWGGPDKMESSVLLVVSPTHAASQVSVVTDATELKASLALGKTKDKNEALLNVNHSVPLLEKLGLPVNVAVTMNSGSHGNGSYYYLVHSNAGNQKITQEILVSKMSETVRVKSHFRHSVNFLEKLGVPANNSIQVELGSVQGKTLTLQSQFGGQQAGMSLEMKCLPITKEVRGAMWHTWSWLQDRGLPLHMEGLCSIRGVFSEHQSRVELTVDGHNLLSSGLNVSLARGRLGLLLSYSPPASNQTGMQQRLDSSLTAQFKGPLRSASVDIHCHDWRVRVVGDVGGWGAHRGSKEARVTLKHFEQGLTNPALQVEAWGRLTESQLRCSMAVNPELSSSLALIIQGHHLAHSTDLVVKVVHSIPGMLVHLPSQLNVHSQLNQSQSSVAGLMEVSTGRRRLWAVGELAAIESGYRQALELKHSYPQLKPLPRAVAVRTVYEARNWSQQVQHGAVWGGQEFILSGLYSSPPALEMGNQTLKVQINCVPLWTGLEVTLERSLRGRHDSVLLDWTRHGRLQQVKAVSWWSRSEETNETKLELKQPFSSTLSQTSFHTLSHSSQREQRSSHQTHLSWDSAGTVNITLNKQWQNHSSRGQACALFSSQMGVSLVKGCVSAGQEGNLYTQNAELRWNNRSVRQGLKYQRGQQGMHSLQVNVGLDRVSAAPCPSHTLLTKLQTNLRDRLEHTVLLGLCPPQPTLSWSGSHRVNSGEELLYTQSRLSVTGRPHQCSLTLALTNSSTAQSSNVSLFSESRIGNWSIEVGGSALSWPGRSGVQLQATLDRREKLWLNGTAEGHCLQTTAGYMNGLTEDVTAVACVRRNLSLTLDVQKREGSGKPQTLSRVSAGSVGRRLMLRATGCWASLTALEARFQYLSSQMQDKLLKRIKTLRHLLFEFRRQSRDSAWLQELSAAALQVTQRAEALLEHRGRGLLALWQDGPPRRILTDGLPRFLALLQHASLLGQQELRRPLATLAGVYQDVKGQRLEVLWREAVSSWTDRLADVLPVLLENPQLSSLAKAAVATLGDALDVAGQHTYHWVDSRLAVALSGVRKQLASVYRFSPSECSVVASVPLPPLSHSRVSEAGLVEILLKEWLLRPLQTLAFVRPTAELYRLKRKIMDSPFTHRALLVADQFVVTFDGHLYELPRSCPLLLAQDVSAEPSFTLLSGSSARDLLLIGMNNSTIHIQHNGQVKANCSSDSGLSVGGRGVVQVSSQNGASVSCDLSLEVCSFTLDGWLHGTSAGVLGTNDNEAGNDFLLPDGSQAENMEGFLYGWQMDPDCMKLQGVTENISKATPSPVSCSFLFSSPDSPLSSCFRVVDPVQFRSVCELSSSRAPCRLASAFVHLCQHNYIPVEVPDPCVKK